MGEEMGMARRVARAIYESAPMFMSAGTDIGTLKKIEWAELSDDDQAEALRGARAAIEAMGEPNEEMIEAAADAYHKAHDALKKHKAELHKDRPELAEKSVVMAPCVWAAPVFAAMLSAALAEGE